MSLTNKMMNDIRAESDARAMDEWFSQDANAERLKHTWRTLSAYQAYRASCAMRDAEASQARKARR